MAKTWRIVLIIALALLVVGAVLICAAWLTGASPSRIVELVFDGPEGAARWWQSVTDGAQTLWDTATSYLRW